MKKLFLDLIVGAVAYYVVSYFFNTLITGTSDVDNMIKALVPLAIGIAIVFVAFRAVK
jgi:uncharacterized membrane protein YeaQ/YmgE (transglycosylase-associated protein family)